MVLKSVVRYTTSLVGALVHTIGGLAALLLVPTLALLVAFLVPSTVGQAGVNSLFDGTVTDVVTDLSAQTPLSTVVLGVSLVALVGLFIFSSKAGYILYDIGKPTTAGSAATTTNDAGGTTTADTPTKSTAEVNLSKFRNTSYFMAGLFGFLTLVFMLFVSDLPARVTGGLSLIFIQFLFAFYVVGYVVAGYSAHNEWVEGVLLGCVLYLFNLISGLLTLNPFGIIIGLLGLKYGLRGVWGANFALLSVDMERLSDRVGAGMDSVRASLSSGSDEDAEARTQSERSADGERADTDAERSEATN